MVRVRVRVKVRCRVFVCDYGIFPFSANLISPSFALLGGP